MQKLQKLLEETPENRHLLTVKKDPELVEFLLSTYPTSVLKEAIYLFRNGLDSAPICQVSGCTNHVKWTNNSHYVITCSVICREQLKKENGVFESAKIKYTQTMIKNHGVANPLKSDAIKEKAIQTKIKKYGSVASDKLRESARRRAPELNRKGRETVRTKYGVDYVAQLPEVREKMQQTLFEKHGVKFSSQIPYVKQANQIKKQKRWDALCTSVKITEWIPPSLELTQKYATPNMRIKFVCDDCGTEECLSSETFRYRSKNFVTPCTICSGISKSRSLQEIALANAVKEFVSNVVANTRKIIKPYEIDIWISDHNMGIEYCGLYWHSEIHDPENKYRHFMKRYLADEQNIKLITVFEDQWLHKRPILLDMIKKTLNSSSISIAIEECDIFEIDEELANGFYEENHILGAGNISKSYGLFHEGQLVSAMSFFNVINSSEISEYELSRYCTKLSTNIKGSTNRLFDYFINNNHPPYIMAKSDLCWCNGSIYDELGFVIEEKDTIELNYWYVDLKKLTRIAPVVLEPNSDDSIEISVSKEERIRDLTRIWDCGTRNYIWLKK